MPRWRDKFTTEGIHLRTLSEVKGGDPVIVRDAGGEFLPRVATTGVIRGGSFLVVWVARSEEIAGALREGDVPEQVPWPATDVWVPGEEPKKDSSDE
jgi:hypothetical protein